MKDAPIRNEVTNRSGLLSTVWVLWFSALVKLVNKFITADDIEITGSDKGLILESPDGTRWRVKVDNTGTLTVTSL